MAEGSIDRYFYFRAHAHPLGWGVGDSKHGSVVAFADKNICFALAALLNRDPRTSVDAVVLLRDFARFADSFDALCARPVFYDSETGQVGGSR